MREFHLSDGLPADIHHDIADLAADGLETLTDEQLLGLARDGQSDAYGVLYARHRYAAMRLSRRLSASVDPDDVVAEAFMQVFDQLKRGNGPQVSFRAYLLMAVRHEVGRRGKAQTRVRPTDDDDVLDSSVSLDGGRADHFERTTVRTAFASLPERWREVLWKLEVEGARPQDIAPDLGLRPNGVSALAYRARAALRDAYVQGHLAAHIELDPECRVVRESLARLIAGSLGRRDAARAESHLDTCHHCRAAHGELTEVVETLG